MRQTEISRQKERETDRQKLDFKVPTTTQGHLRMSTDRQLETEKVEERERGREREREREREKTLTVMRYGPSHVASGSYR